MNKNLLLTLGAIIFILWTAFVIWQMQKTLADQQNQQNIVIEKPNGREPVIENPTYECPKNGYINCMPTFDETTKRACDSQYIDWVKANCPNFEGIAY